jgi:hypothetical protein
MSIIELYRAVGDEPLGLLFDVFPDVFLAVLFDIRVVVEDVRVVEPVGLGFTGNPRPVFFKMSLFFEEGRFTIKDVREVSFRAPQTCGGKVKLIHWSFTTIGTLFSARYRNIKFNPAAAFASVII